MLSQGTVCTVRGLYVLYDPHRLWLSKIISCLSVCLPLDVRTVTNVANEAFHWA